MDKLQMKTPLVEMDGDEMTRILWQQIKEELLEPYIDLKTEYYDLGLPEREILAAAVELNRLRGTKKGLQMLSRLVIGQPCEIAEQFQWEEGIRSAREREDCKRLYSGGRSGVTLLFPAGTSSEKLSTLKAVLDDFIPLGVPYTVVRREEAAAMDGHGYLDGGAEIPDPPPAELDGPENGEWILE